MSALRIIDMFAGIGGFSLGLHRAGGFETVAFAETDPYASRVLEARFPGVPNVGDVTVAEYPNAEVICAGFPCQDISFAGAGAGLAGARSGLWREVVRAIRVVRPRFAILENVAALLNRGMGTVLGDMASIGHDAEWHCIPASAVGAPHRRDRIWIVANPQCVPSGERSEPNVQRRRPHETEQAGLGCSGAVANSYGLGCDWGAKCDLEPPTGLKASRRDDTQRRGSSRTLGEWWAVEPSVGRVAHGIPGRVDRLRCLGNAVVPQIPEMIGRAILAAIADRNPKGGDAQLAPSRSDESGGAGTAIAQRKVA